MQRNAAQAYFQTSVNTTSQEELVIMLYEAAISFLGEAKKKIEEKDFAQKGICISNALDIIAELDSTLNIQKGGELAGNLHDLYLYMRQRLLFANMNLDIAIVDEVIGLMSKLKSAFDDIMPAFRNGGKPMAAAQQASPYQAAAASM